MGRFTNDGVGIEDGALWPVRKWGCDVPTYSRTRARRLSLSFGVVSLGVVSLLVLAQDGRAQGQEIATVTDLGIVSSYAAAVNDLGQVAGTESVFPQQGFLWDAGVVTSLAIDGASDVNRFGQVVGYRLQDPRGGMPTPVVWDDGVVTDLAGSGVASAINDVGQIVGSRTGLLPDGEESPVLWQNGAIVDLPIPFEDGHGGFAKGINESGQIAGTVLDLFMDSHAVIWTGGVPTELGLGEAAAINDAGQVVGTQSVSDAVGNTEYFAVLWDHGTVVPLGSGVALGINNAGQVVGYRVVGPDSQWAPVIWQDGVETVLPVRAGSVSTFATDINDAGQIVGTERDSAGHEHALMWTLAPTTTITPIDIKPGSRTNRVNLNGNGAITVALLSTDDFDAATVRIDTVCFGDADDASQRDCTTRGRAHHRDIDRDGRTDVVLRFDTNASGIDKGDTQACVSGETIDARRFAGCDSVTTTT